MTHEFPTVAAPIHSMRFARKGREDTTVAAAVIIIGFVVAVNVAILKFESTIRLHKRCKP